MDQTKLFMSTAASADGSMDHCNPILHNAEMAITIDDSLQLWQWIRCATLSQTRSHAFAKHKSEVQAF